MIHAERAEVLRLRGEGSVPDDILARVLADIDVEESILERSDVADSDEREVELTSPAPHSCEHLDGLRTVPAPETPDGCAECLAQGSTWVHLRLCMTCGHVGCCDSSEYRHSTAHFKDTEHPVIRSFQPGEAWRWCFVDHRLG
jgi:CPA1 family monovalent cation:H+ antiporter